MAAANSIGTEQFLSLQRPPSLLKTSLERLQRPGVDGTGFWDVGRHGRPFSLRSACDYASFSAAMEAFERYRTMIDDPPKTVTYGGVDLDTQALFQVLDVNIVVISALGSASDGGLNSPSLGWLEAEWTLEPIPL